MIPYSTRPSLHRVVSPDASWLPRREYAGHALQHTKFPVDPSPRVEGQACPIGPLDLVQEKLRRRLHTLQQQETRLLSTASGQADRIGAPPQGMANCRINLLASAIQTEDASLRGLTNGVVRAWVTQSPKATDLRLAPTRGYMGATDAQVWGESTISLFSSCMKCLLPLPTTHVHPRDRTQPGTSSPCPERETPEAEPSLTGTRNARLHLHKEHNRDLKTGEVRERVVEASAGAKAVFFSLVPTFDFELFKGKLIRWFVSCQLALL